MLCDCDTTFTAQLLATYYETRLSVDRSTSLLTQLLARIESRCERAVVEHVSLVSAQSYVSDAWAQEVDAKRWEGIDMAGLRQMT